MTERWEYLSVTDLPVSPRSFKEGADQYGVAGWELVAVLGHRFIFKRRLSND